ncbi:MAG: N-acetylmuramic acid 6-phosphate etherase family protein [Armatimonadota bacterium]
MDDYRAQAEHFLTCEKQFHLGIMPTEQPHPKTKGLAETLQQDAAAGVRMLQEVDQDVVAMARRVLVGEELQLLFTTMAEAIAAGHRVCFSGCGATGRLSIMLEAMWHWFWRDLAQQPQLAAVATEMADRVTSIMTGGDYALIRSVEGFEDYASFGRQQVIDAGLGAGDVLVAISEGGETSSVIGTLHEATERGLRAFFVFNNPADILSANIERSREVIQSPLVTVLDLATGPMAVCGSTRMQATTAELLAVGTALEQALARLLPQVLPADALASLPQEWLTPVDPVDQFGALLDDLAQPAAVAAMVEWIDLEHDLYAAGGRITYFAGECLLDIFTDTTERAPTFMLPPFRKSDDLISPPSWAFVKDPTRTTPEAWHNVLGRTPRCLDWDSARYESLGAPASVVASPPALGCVDLMKFLIGSEVDPSRTEVSPNVAMQVLLAPELQRPQAALWQDAFQVGTAAFDRRAAVVIGGTEASAGTLHVPCRLTSTPLGLWDRLAAKLVLNTISSATMGKLGRLVSNWMANVECSNKKLIDRGTRLVSELTGLDYEAACVELHRTIAEQKATAKPGQARISPVAQTVQRLRS